MRFFNIATNLTSGPFMIGYEDDPDDFYLKGEIIEGEALISCRLFDSRGQFLFSMEKNNLSTESMNRYRTKHEGSGFVVSDDKGTMFLKLQTREEAGRIITYIEGQFFDKKGRLAARGDERSLLVNCPLRI